MGEPALAVLPVPEKAVWGRVAGLVLDAITSPHSRRAYARAIEGFLAWYAAEGRGEPLSKALVQRHRARLEGQGLAPSSINQRLSAIRRLAAEAADNGLLAPELAAGVARVKGVRQAGVRLGNWLTREQAERLLALPGRATLKGLRDGALLALLVGCGLRREEMAALTIDRIQQREGRWIVADLVGKGGRVRSVPMAAWTKAAVDRWTAAAGIVDGRLLRPINKAGRIVGQGMTAQSVYEIITGYAAQVGVRFAPHDLRRTYAKLAHRGGARLEQIQRNLGHASLTTTEDYLGVELDLHDAPCDHLGLRMG